jgi:branched-chain amino acid transport system permease protein
MSRALALLACAAALVAVPALAGTFQVTLLTQAFVWAILGLSVWLLLRVCGLASFGHAAFFGVGAYVAGLAVVEWEIGNVFVALALGVAIGCLVALPIALVAARLRGVAFLMITLAFAEMLRALAGRWEPLGGTDGLVGVIRPDAAPLPLELSGPVAYYYFTLAALGCVLAGLAVFVRSPVGGALAGIRESPARMAALGYNAAAYRVLAFVVSAGIAAPAGVLNAYLNRFVDPGDLSALVSAKALLIVVVGGGSLAGPALGAIALTELEELLSSTSERWLGLLGVIYVVVARAAPGPGALARARAALRLPRPVGEGS